MARDGTAVRLAVAAARKTRGSRSARIGSAAAPLISQIEPAKLEAETCK